MKIKREKLLLLNSILQQAERIFKAPISGKFYYTVTRNRNKAEEERKLCYEAYPVDQTYLEYDQKRLGIFSEEGIHTDMQLRELSVKEPEKFNAIQERQRKLADEYKDAIEAENKMAEARNEFFKEDLEIEIRQISSSELPEIDPKSGFKAWDVLNALEPMVSYPSNVTTKTVEREKILKMNGVLYQAEMIFGNNVSSKFYAAVKHNREKAEEERKLCYEAYPVDPKFIEYDQNRLAIFGEEGIVNDDQLRALAANDPEKFNAIQERQRKLIEEYKDAIEAEKKMGTERQAYFKENVTIDLQLVTMDDIPEFADGEHINTWEVFDALAPMIDFAEDSNKE
jgi:hypothetical protein